MREIAGSPIFYEEFARELEEEIPAIEEDLKYWNERVVNNRVDSEIRKDCQQIIRKLLNEKEKILWKAKLSYNTGQKLREYLKKEESKENQSFQPD